MTDHVYAEGTGYIEEMGWLCHPDTKEPRFVAIVVFPNGAPEVLTAQLIWRHWAVTIVRVEPDA